MVPPSVAELCQATFGIDLADGAARDHITLAINEVGALHFEDRGDELLIYLARDIAAGEDRLRIQRAALSAVHHQNATPWPVQAGWRDQALIFLTRLPAREAVFTDLEGAIELLAALQNEVQG